MLQLVGKHSAFATMKNVRVIKRGRPTLLIGILNFILTRTSYRAHVFLNICSLQVALHITKETVYGQILVQYYSNSEILSTFNCSHPTKDFTKFS